MMEANELMVAGVSFGGEALVSFQWIEVRNPFRSWRIRSNNFLGVSFHRHEVYANSFWK